jgi:hypothetical protein
MQTIVQIPDELYEQVVSVAATEGVPVADVIARGLRLALGQSCPRPRGRITFPLHHSAKPGTLGMEDVRAAEEAAAQEEDQSRGRIV